MIVVVDSDALIALFNKEDPHSKTVEKLVEVLHEQKARLIYPVTTLVETVDTMQRKIKNHEVAVRVVQLITESYLANESIESVNNEELKEAAKIYKKGFTNKTTLADSVVAAIAKKYNADAILSFDEWYQKQGFKLVVDIGL
jgi:predicted nucleic acid-binding protein